MHLDGGRETRRGWCGIIGQPEKLTAAQTELEGRLQTLSKHVYPDVQVPRVLAAACMVYDMCTCR